MRWRSFSQVKFYLSLAVAMVGLSAAAAMIVSQEPATRVLEGNARPNSTDLLRENIASVPGADNVSVTTSPAGANLQADKIARLTMELKALQRKFGDTHPTVQELTARIEDEKAYLADTLSEARKYRQSQTATLGNVKTEVLTEDIRPDGTRIISQTNVPMTLPQRVYSTVQPAESQKLRKALEQLRSSGSDGQAKDAARQTAKDILEQQFDEDMEQRSRKIAAIEKQLATLKEQMEKRKAAKNRLIDLRIELLMNEEEGLGFPASWQQPPVVSFPFTIDSNNVQYLAPGANTRYMPYVQPSAAPLTVAPAAPAPPAPPAALAPAPAALAPAAPAAPAPAAPILPPAP